MDGNESKSHFRGMNGTVNIKASNGECVHYLCAHPGLHALRPRVAGIFVNK